MKSALHEGVQDIGWRRMSRTYCVCKIMKIKRVDGFEQNSVRVLQRYVQVDHR